MAYKDKEYRKQLECKIITYIEHDTNLNVFEISKSIDWHFQNMYAWMAGKRGITNAQFIKLSKYLKKYGEAKDLNKVYLDKLITELDQEVKTM